MTSPLKPIPIHEFDPNKNVTIYLLGDVEGDATMINNWFLHKGLITPTYDWNPEMNNVLVFQLGDQVDKYQNARLRRKRHETQSREEDYKVVYLFDELNKRSNGRVQSILGNHEIMNVQGDYRYAGLEASRDGRNFIRKRDRLFRDPNSSIFQMLRKRPYALYFRGLLLTHAGITPDQIQVAQDVYGVKTMKELITLINSVPLESWMDTNETMISVDNPQWFIIHADPDGHLGGIVWNRDFDHDRVMPGLMRFQFQALDVPNAVMVIGHNVLHDVEVCTMNSCSTANAYQLDQQGRPAIIKVDTGKSARLCENNQSKINVATIEMRHKEIVSIRQETYVWNCDHMI